MATQRFRQTESLKDDLISNLPVEVKDRILECLPTYDVARTAVLSKHWNDVWLRHPRLVFDDDLYLKCAPNYKGHYNERLVFANIIYDVLLRRTGPVKKFTLRVSEYYKYLPEQHDLDRWCLILSRNGVEELNLLSVDFDSWRLPLCIVSCRTIKELRLSGFIFDFPLNNSCIFPNVTLLFLFNVSFDNYEIVSTIPNLETIGFPVCSGFDMLKISAPKLESVVVLSRDDMDEVEWIWVTNYWNTMKTLCLNPYSLLDSVRGERYLEPETFPSAMNLQTLQLYHLCLENWKHITLAMQLLGKSPNLCQLEIEASLSSESGTNLSNDHKEAALGLFKDPNSCCIDQNLEMLHTVKIESFGGTKLEMLFVKTLLAKSPALDKLIITRGEDINASKASEIAIELMGLPRASHKAQIYFICNPLNLMFYRTVQDFWVLIGES